MGERQLGGTTYATRLYPPEEGPYTHVAKNEEANGRKTFTTRLPTGYVQNVSRVQTTIPNH